MYYHNQTLTYMTLTWINRLEPLSGRIASVSELVPEEHRTSRGQVAIL
jgi:hypothetical protein